MNKYYTYAYLRPNYLPYYIGKGCGKRCFIGNSKRNAKKPQQKHLIVKLRQNLTEAEAFAWEKHYIQLFGLASTGGILHNFTEGGEGAAPSEATKLKISASLKGRTHSPELIELRSSKLRGRKQSPARIKQRALSLQKTITLIDTIGASITLESIKDCAKQLNVSTSSIHDLKKGKSKTCRGYTLS